MNLNRRPLTNFSWRGDLARIEFCRDRAERARAGGLDVFNGWNELRADLARFLATQLARCSSNLCKALSLPVAVSGYGRSLRACGLRGRTRKGVCWSTHPGDEGRTIRIRAALARSTYSIDGRVDNSDGLDTIKAGVVLQFLNGHIVTATLDKEGRFDFVHLPPGEYKLSAWNHLGLFEYWEASFLDGYADRSKKIDLEANTHPSLLELTPILLPQ